jgi:hypothetical protein
MSAKTEKDRVDGSISLSRQTRRNALLRDPKLTLLSGAEQDPILLQRKVHLYQLSPGQQLHDHSTRQDGRDSEFHQGSPITSQDDPHPVERVGRVRGHDPVERYLGHDEKDEEGGRCPEGLVVEGDLPVGRGHLGEDAHERADELEEADCRRFESSGFVPYKMGIAV